MTQPESTESTEIYELVDGKHLPNCNERCGGGVHFLGPGKDIPARGEAANVPVVDPARVARYAEIADEHRLVGVSMYETTCACGGWPTLKGPMSHLEHVIAAVVAVADAELAELRAEVEQLRRGGRELGRMVVRHGEMVLNATGLHDWIDEDGDGDWAAVWENLATLRPRAEVAEAESASRAEQIRTLVDDRAVWRERALLAEARVRAVETAVERRSKLHARWNGVQELVVTVEDLRAALAGAAAEGEPVAEWCDDADPKGGRACHLRRGHTGQHTGGRHSWPVEAEDGE